MTMESIAPASTPYRDRPAATSPPPTPSIPVIPRAVFDYDVAIVGLGYVGLPTALTLHASGARVIGVDASEARLDEIRAVEADLLEFDRIRLAEALLDERFLISDDADLLAGAAAIVICVPTPIDEHLTPDLDILRTACATVVRHAVAGQLVMLTSTTYAGCTRDLLLAPLEARGLTAGRDIHVAFSPERIDPGNDRFTHEDVPRVVGGATPACLETAVALIGRSAHSVHPVASLEAAEMTKLLENTFRAVNIALANEFAEACLAIDVPVMEVIEAAATKPYGFMPFYPGPGVGGHCIPCDPHYLLWQLRSEHIVLPLIEQAMSEIAVRPRRVVERVRQVLADRGRTLLDARILVDGIAYKPDVADVRESPAVEIIERLHAAGAIVAFHDPYFDDLALRDGTVVHHTPAPREFGADLVVLHTAHVASERSWLADEATVLDTTYRGTDVPQRVLL